MKNLICNKETLKRAEEETILAFKECYLRLQHCLLTLLEDSETPKDKEKYQKWIWEVGETYKKVEI